MPILPLPPGASALAGGALPIASAADVLAEFPTEHREPEVSPVRDAFAEGFTSSALLYQAEAARAAAQADPTRATGIYLDLHGADKDVRRRAGELDPDYRARIFATPATVTPVALLDGINALLAQVTTQKAQLFEPELDGVFAHAGSGTEGYQSFVGTGPSYPDRLYVADANLNEGIFVEGGDPGGAVPPFGDHGRCFVVRIPALEGVDEATLAALTGGADGVFLFNGTETVGTCHLFKDAVSADSIYAAIVDYVQRFKGQGIVWALSVEANYVEPTVPVVLPAVARSISSILPSSGIVVGGAPFEIHGAGFTGATAATIGSQSLLDFTVVSDILITGTTPTNLLALHAVGVSGGPGGTVSMPAAFNCRQWRGVNHTIYSQSTWIAGAPNPGANYQASDHRTIDYFNSKGVNHLRMLFTWEWLQPTALFSAIPGALSGAYLTYWNAFVETVAYATSLGMQVTIGHYGWSNNYWPGGGGNTTPSWKGVGSANGTSYTNQIGGGTVTNAAFNNLWTQLASYFLTNPLVSFDLVNEPHDMSTMQWFATAQSAITAIRATGSRAWIHIQGNGYSTYLWTTNTYDTAATKRSSAYGWSNANGVGAPISDPLNRLIATPHFYLDDMGGTTNTILAVGAGTVANAALDRLKTVVDWARPLGVKVHAAELGWYAGNAAAPGAWANFITYCNANSDVVTGYNWFAASDIGWWSDINGPHFSITPTTAGVTYTGDTINMDMIEASFP